LPECERAARPFIIYTAGCSRTAWLASFLTYGDCRCRFETLMRQRTIEDAIALLQPRTGSAETAAAPLWRLFDAVPGLRRVVVKRPPSEILASMQQRIADRLPIDWPLLESIVADLRVHLEEISAAPGTLTVEFADLSQEKTCAAIFEHCLPYPYDRKWWRAMRNRNIEVDVVDFLLRPFATAPV